MWTIIAHAGGVWALVLVGFPVFGGIILAAYLASRRRPGVKRLSTMQLRRSYARGAITARQYEAELRRRGLTS